jgi:hypothetical protein
MDPEKTLERWRAIADARPTRAEIDELVAALARKDGVERYVDDPGWSGFGAPLTEVVEVAAVAQQILGRHAKATLLPVARAYRGLPAAARARVRELFEQVKPAVWDRMGADTRAEIVEAISGVPAGEPDSAECERFRALHLWHHRLLLAAERHDEQGAIPLIVAGLTGGNFWQEHRAAEIARRFRESVPLASAIAMALLEPPADAVSAWFGAALENTGAKLPKGIVGRLAAALERPRSSGHEWALICALEPYAKDRERLGGRGRSTLVGALARLCLTTPNEGHLRWASAMVGRDEVGRALAPMLAERLRDRDENVLVDAAERAAFFGPSMAPLLPLFAKVLEADPSPRLRHWTTKAIEAIAPAGY